MIPLVKTNLPPPEILMKELENIIYSGYIAEGEEVVKFELLLKKFFSNQNVLTFNSGTSALHTALILAGVGPGDEVISTVLTAEPTNMAILHTGAKIVWADIDPSTGILSPESVRNRINEKTKAVVVVHYAGIPANIDAFTNIADEYNISVIEDAAHALGAEYKGKMIGNHSPFVAFSFQAIKHLTTGDGGALIVNRPQDVNKARLIRWFGIDKNIPRDQNNITVIGYKYHMNNIAAAIGCIQMQFIEKKLSIHKENGIYFDTHLKGIDGIRLLDYYPDSLPSYWLYTMKVDRRDDFIHRLNDAGISASALHVRNDQHQVFGRSPEPLENADKFCNEYVHIPCGWWVDKHDREFITETIKKGW